jgi:hypothetical protein
VPRSDAALTRAAMIYLHSSDEQQCQSANALGELAAGELKRKPGRARRRKNALRRSTSGFGERPLICGNEGVELGGLEPRPLACKSQYRTASRALTWSAGCP